MDVSTFTDFDEAFEVELRRRAMSREQADAATQLEDLCPSHHPVLLPPVYRGGKCIPLLQATEYINTKSNSASNLIAATPYIKRAPRSSSTVAVRGCLVLSEASLGSHSAPLALTHASCKSNPGRQAKKRQQLSLSVGSAPHSAAIEELSWTPDLPSIPLSSHQQGTEEVPLALRRRVQQLYTTPLHKLRSMPLSEVFALEEMLVGNTKQLR